LYIERTSALQVVRRLREARLIPQVPSLFVSNNGAVSRHEDFTCNSDYAHFIAHDVVNWARKEYPGLRDVIIVGLSLSGLAAAYIAARHPAVFRAAICQSPSFWWEKARFANDLPTAERPEHEFWISVGSRETDTGVSHPPSGLFQGMTQVASCSLTAAALRAKGYGVSYREYDGGHDPNCWREDLALALPWVWRRES
jgi:enterochelin esterase family protein